MVTSAEAIEKLETALASGALEVEFEDGRKVKYRSASEIRSAIEHFRAKVTAAAGRPAVNVTVGSYFRG
jgi:hypothetical protein